MLTSGGKIILLLCVFVAAAQNVDQDTKLVTIAQGPVLGYRNTDHDIFEFFGIPYATAPTGTKRYMAALPPRTWTQTLDAVDQGIICPQLQTLSFVSQKTMQEDCLIANIYAPNTEETNLPVLVTVHGGAYSMGFGHEWAPRRIAGTKKVVAVTFNYRIGAHGFLCLGTKKVPGNAGLKDQVALLRWVRDNIAHFGGNPEDVTIQGFSAGASAVDLLMISRAADGLFNKVIPESGANVASWSAHSDPIESAKHYAGLLNFTNVNNIDALEEFYTTVPYDVLNSIPTDKNYDSNQYFSPCIENDVGEEMFMDDSPVNIIKTSRYTKVPLLYGFTDMEGLLRILHYDNWVHKMNEDFSEFLPKDLEFESEEERQSVAQTVREFYFGEGRIGINLIFGYINFFTDVVWAYPMLRSVQMQVEAGHDSIYLYEYTFYKKFPSVPGIPDALINKPGADHCDQTFSVLDFSLVITAEENYTEEYRQMRATMLELWVNFITTGTPVPEGSTLPAWLPVSANRTPHMHLGDTVELRYTPINEARAQLWDDLYERYYREPGPPQFSSANMISHNSVTFFLIIFIAKVLFYFIYSLIYLSILRKRTNKYQNIVDLNDSNKEPITGSHR